MRVAISRSESSERRTIQRHDQLPNLRWFSISG
jgi:hypothetical protein